MDKNQMTVEQLQTDMNDLMKAIQEIYGDEAVKTVANKAMSYRGTSKPMDIYQTVDTALPEEKI